MTVEPKQFDMKKWNAHIKQKYSGKSIPFKTLHEQRVLLEKKYGEKIILGKLEDMDTDEEKMDKIEYEAIGDVLGEMSPEYKKGDEMVKNAYRNQRAIKSLFEKAKSIFWPILGILLILAIIKYLLS